MNFPADLKYSSDHEWVRVDGETVTLGITDFAQSELGDVVFVEMPEVGDRVTKDKAMGTIEAVKTVSDIISPVNGEIVEINAGLDDAPETVNDDPYGEGWMVRIRISDPSELDAMMDAEKYQEHIG